MIEDTELPARFNRARSLQAAQTKLKGTAGGLKLLPLEEAVTRLAAACKARQEGMLIFGRTSAHCSSGTEELLARLKEMKDVCGLDGIVIIGPDLTESDWAKIRDLELGLPILVGGGLHKKELYTSGRAPAVAVEAGMRALLTGSDAFWTGLVAASEIMRKTAPNQAAAIHGLHKEFTVKEFRQDVTRSKEYVKQLKEYGGIHLSDL